jgi:hypothetical protein
MKYKKKKKTCAFTLPHQTEILQSTQIANFLQQVLRKTNNHCADKKNKAREEAKERRH